jgi:hypothetical protein
MVGRKKPSEPEKMLERFERVRATLCASSATMMRAFVEYREDIRVTRISLDFRREA